MSLIGIVGSADWIIATSRGRHYVQGRMARDLQKKLLALRSTSPDVTFAFQRLTGFQDGILPARKRITTALCSTFPHQANGLTPLGQINGFRPLMKRVRKAVFPVAGLGTRFL